MQYLYVIIIVLCVNAFLSEKINTHNLLKKIGLLMILVGVLIANYQFDRLFRIENPFIALGVTCYFASEYITAHFRKPNSRKTDKATQ